MIVAIDFDGTLCDPDNVLAGYRMGQPYPGAGDVLWKLHNRGDTIIIHTCRATVEPAWFHGVEWKYNPKNVKHIEDWLRFFAFPFDSVWQGVGKPYAHAYVDDRAIAFDGDWDVVGRQLDNLKREVG